MGKSKLLLNMILLMRYQLKAERRKLYAFSFKPLALSLKLFTTS